MRRILVSFRLMLCIAGPGFCQPNPAAGAFPSWALLPFIKQDALNPVLTASAKGIFRCPILNRLVRWEAKDLFNPAAIVRGGKVFLLFRAQDSLHILKGGTSRIGLAWSSDGLHFKRASQPVLFPQQDSWKRFEWPGGTEDPRVVMRSDGLYVMTYTAYDGKTARLCLASSRDLIHWKKYGPVLGGPFRNLWSKSGAILCRRVGGRLLACRIQGSYWMYWGDTEIFILRSRDLLHWVPVLKPDGSMRPLMGPRKGYFDSRLVESGPLALLRKSGILFIYNSMNAQRGGDPSLPAGTYSPGQALIDPRNPTRVLARTDQEFMKPDKPYEIRGQVNRVCFVEGLVWFRDKWFLYYGTADSRIAVAVLDPGIRGTKPTGN